MARDDATTPSRAFMFGISGATWSVADRLIAAGRMPNLKRLRETGSWGTLLSVRAEGDKHYRPQIAWMTLATGCLPQHHGVTAFYQTMADCHRPCIWDSFLGVGRSVGLFRWPLTWPPKPVNGFVVPCYHARDDATWPPELSAITSLDRQRHEAARDREAGDNPSIRELLGLAKSLWLNGVGGSRLAVHAGRLCKALATGEPQLRSLVIRRARDEILADVFLHLYRSRRPDLATFHTFFVDQVSHRYWRYYEPERFEPANHDDSQITSPALRSAVEDAYVFTDCLLGRILRRLAPGTVVAVVSEHGMAPEPVSAEVGDWQYTIRGVALARFVGLLDELTACPIARWIAYRPRQGNVIPSGAAERFRAVTVVETGLPLFNVYAHGPDEVIVKFRINADTPGFRERSLEDLHVEYDGHRAGFREIARRAGRARSAMHDQRGILAIAGPGIRTGVSLTDSSLVDFAPTLLATVGLSPCGPVDGKVIDIFARAPEQQGHDVIRATAGSAASSSAAV